MKEKETPRRDRNSSLIDLPNCSARHRQLHSPLAEMASAAMAAMLDELMGRNRNTAPNDKNRVTHWSDDPEVCRFYLVDFCPHELFTNTKADLGPCGKVHDDNMRKIYEEEKEGTYR